MPLKENLTSMEKLYKYTIEKGALSSVDIEERAFFFSLGHVANDINLLSKQMVWCDDLSSEVDHMVKGQLTLSLFFYRTLAGKLNEANELIKKSFLSKKYSKVYVDLFDDKTRETLTSIKKYFGKSNIVNKIRNSHSFHYSAEDFTSNLDELPDDLEIYLHKTQGNSLYYASELLATYAMVKSCGESDFSKLFDNIVSELISISKLILSFSYQFMSVFINERHKSLNPNGLEELDLNGLIDFKDVKIPWFVNIIENDSNEKT